MSFLILLSAAPAVLGENCDTLIPLDPGAHGSAHPLEAGEFAVFGIDVAERGVLMIDAKAPVGADAEPRLAFADAKCQPTAAPDRGLRVLRRFVGAMALAVETPGTYRFAVAAQDPRDELDEVDFVTRFLGATRHCGDLSDKAVPEPEPDPDFLRTCLAKAVPEPEPDPDFAKAVPEPEPDPDFFEISSSPICLRDDGDDHGDVFWCATAVASGEAVTANWQAVWHGDADVFVFSIAAQQTVTVDVRSEHGAIVALYDRHGHRLRRAAGFSDARLATTLTAGVYYLRVAEPNGGEGSYTMELHSAGW